MSEAIVTASVVESDNLIERTPELRCSNVGFLTLSVRVSLSEIGGSEGNRGSRRRLSSAQSDKISSHAENGA